ncbi:MAG: hypothetical protein A2144_04615 [Chloroflexi bacterium RBG_16_50_9]|nr:MAG: hypothetical protein A2144_04615 [Chloroflexi bacterium RBG_16_50_9]
MKSMKLQRLIFIPVIASLLVMAGCSAAPPTVPVENPVIIRQSGGAGANLAECQDRDYLSSMADYIVEGTVTGVESRWNEENTGIYTYSDFTVTAYIKGTPFPTNTIQIVTPGGTVGDITQGVEDQPIFHEGRRVRLYMEKVNDEFTIVCGRFGVEGLEIQAIPAPCALIECLTRQVGR